MEQKIEGYYSGTSGLLLPVPNKLHYPEAFKDRSRLCYYGSLMDSIEINSSFYKVPMASTVKKWIAEVPTGFRFTFKLFKGITHAPGLGFDPAEIAKFMDVASYAGDKKGCILVQLPPSIKIGNLPQIAYLMSTLRCYDCENAWHIAFEFRDSSLYVDEMVGLLDEYGFGMVIHDKRGAASPMGIIESAFCYLRFHGPGGDYKGSYSEDVLAEYASYVAEWLLDGKKVFVYFNNTMGDAYGNLKTLQRFVADLV